MADGLLNKASIILTPTGYKAGTLYNVSPVEEPYSDFDFARTSVASRVNSSGLVEMVGRTLSGELVTNGDFATDSDWILGTGWTISGGKLNAVGAGQYVVQKNIKSQGTSATLKVQWTQTILSGTRLRFFARNYNDGGNETVLSASATDGAVFASGNCIGSGTYTVYVSVTNGYSFKMLAELNNSATVDNVSVIEIIDTNNIPRISYDNNGDNGHILLEPTTTNLYLYTDELSTQNVITSASDYSVSFYGTGTITFSGSYSGSLVGTGVNDRVSLTFTATSGTLTSTVSGSVTNAQIENLGYSTSYMPSIFSQGVRATETATGAGSTDLINSTEGVLYAEIAALDNDGTNRILGISDGTASNRVNILFGTNNNRIRAMVVSGGAIQFDEEYITTSSLNYHKLALKYKANDFALWIDGTEEFTESSGSVPIGLNDLSFDMGNGSFYFYGKCKALAVFNEALSDSELTQLTT